MIDRINGPLISDEFAIDLPQIEHISLDNGLKVYLLNSSVQPIIKLDFCTRAGRIYENKRAVARSTISLMKDETQTYDSEALSEQIEFYGAELGSSLNLDTARISLSTLEQHLDEVLPVFVEVLTKPKFTAQNFKNRQSIAAQKLKNQISKNNIIAYRELSKLIFDENNPYGYNTNPEDILNVNIDDLNAYFEKNIAANNSALFLSGKINDQSRELILEAFNQLANKHEFSEKLIKSAIGQKGIKVLNKGQDHQTTINLGAKLFNRAHPDFNDVFVLNTILGGYFSSRLMSNIREEKGYCYNIYSTLECMRQDGFWYISADVGNEYIESTSDEIRKEIKVLQTELISADELKMVKNYLQGHIMSMLDGPFSSSKVFQGAWKYEIDMDYILKFASDIKRISSERILELANKYYNLDEILELRVGKGTS